MDAFKYFLLGLPWGGFIFWILLPLGTYYHIVKTQKDKVTLLWGICAIILVATTITIWFSASLLPNQGTGFAIGTILGWFATKNLNAQGK